MPTLLLQFLIGTVGLVTAFLGCPLAYIKMSFFEVLFGQFVMLDLHQCIAFFSHSSYLRGFFSWSGRS